MSIINDCVLDLEASMDLEPAATPWYDLSRYKNNGTVVGATWEQLPSGLWVERYGGADYVNIDVVLNDLAATTTGTWMSWLKLDDATPAANTALISFGDTSAAEWIELLIQANGFARLHAYKAGAVQFRLATDAAAISNGVWVHIAGIQDATSPIILVNGVQVAQTFSNAADKTIWFSGLAGLDNGNIGSSVTSGLARKYFISNGNIILTKIYTYAWTVGQIRNYYEKTKYLFGVHD